MEKPTSVIEIGVQVTEKQLKGIVAFLRLRRIPHYIEPQRKNPYTDLVELEADCEGK